MKRKSRIRSRKISRSISRSRSRSRSKNIQNIKKTSSGIPKIIHQIWIGNQTPYLNSLYINSCKNMKGWRHKIWNNYDITNINFPITFPYIKKIFDIGEKTNTLNQKYAQIADLMRLEILYNYGGVYVDTSMECVNNFDKLLNNKDYKFVIANEDSCGFDCKNDKGNYYISNGFFASTKNNTILKNMLKKESLNTIDFYSPFVNRETGPYFFGKHLHKYKNKKKVYMVPTEYIYPCSITDDNKCLKRKEFIGSNLEIKDKFNKKIYLQYPCKKYPSSYTVRFWEVGGTWW